MQKESHVIQKSMKQSGHIYSNHCIETYEEIKERFQAGLQLLLDLFLAAFEHVHGDVSFTSVLELESCVADLGDFFGWQQAHAIDECQVCHELILNLASDFGLQTSDPYFAFVMVCEAEGKMPSGLTALRRRLLFADAMTFVLLPFLLCRL